MGETPGVSDLLVISGPPGSGKSTVAAAVAASLEPSVLVEGDAFFGFLRGGTDPWLPEADDQNRRVIEAAGAACGRFAAAGPTVYEGVLGPWFLDAFLRATGIAALDYVVLLPPVAVCLERVADRPDHPFADPSATGQVHGDFAGSGIDPRHLVTDGTASPSEVAALVRAERASGRFEVRR